MWFLAPDAQDPWTRALVARWTRAGVPTELISLAGQDEARLDEALAVGGPRIVAGFSRGARWLIEACGRLSVKRLVCVSFPFHRRDDPADTHGLRALRGVQARTLIVQGTRDPHGTREQVTSYGPLPSCVSVHWVEDGNHRLRPRERSGLDAERLLDDVTQRVQQFCGLP